MKQIKCREYKVEADWSADKLCKDCHNKRAKRMATSANDFLNNHFFGKK